jgi:uncharacterized protein
VTVRGLRLALEDPAVDAVTAAVHRPARRTGAPVLLAPGAGGDLDGDGLVALAERFAALGHPAVRVNLPHHEAGRRAAPRAERSVRPYAQLLDAAQRELGVSGPWILGGKSYGGRVASMAVAEGTPALGLVFYGYPLHPPGKPDRLRVDHWPHVGVPCLFVQGERDPFCDQSLLSSHVRKLPRRTTVHVVPGGDHSLRVPKAASPTGTPISASTIVASLDGVLQEWLVSLEP